MNRLLTARNLALAVGTAAWFAYVVVRFTLHHPDVTQFNGLGEGIAGAVGFALLLFIAGASAGTAVVSRVCKIEQPLLSLVISCGLGLGLITELVFLLGLVGLAQRPAVIILLGVAIVSGAPEMLRQVRAVARSATLSPALLALMLLFGLYLVSAVAPPVQWDELSYHLPNARLIAETGHYHLAMDDSSYQPELHETLTAMGMMFGVAPSLGRVIHTFFGILLVVIAYIFGARITPDRSWAGWLAATIVAVDPVVQIVAAWANVDLTLAFYTVAALGLLAFEEGERRIWLVGALAGFSASVGYRGLYSCAALFAAALALRPRDAGRLALAGFIAACPWYLRNLVVSGDPFLPFFTSVFHISKDVPTQFSALGWPDPSTPFNVEEAGITRGLLPSLLAPWDATFLGHHHELPFDASTSPLFLASIPFFLLARREAYSRKTLAVLVFIVVHTVLWAIGIQGLRYQLSVLGALAILIPSMIRNLRISWLEKPAFAAAWIVNAGLFVAAFITYVSGPELRYFTGNMHLNDYLVSVYDGTAFRNFLDVNRDPNGGPVLMLGEKRSFYITRPTIRDINWVNLKVLYKNGGGTPEGMYELLRRSGIHDILVHSIMLEQSSTPEQLRAFATMIREHARLRRGVNYMLWYQLQ